MVQQACTHQGNAGYFYMDGVQMATEGLDWCQGSWLQVVAETQAIANRVGGENIGPMYYCELGLNSVCTPGTGISAGCSNLHGCASPSNPYGCYSQTSSNSFKTWDSRSTPC
jgi:hypothetical protein